MGGLAAIVEWERNVASEDLDPMLALIPHRAAGGTRRRVFSHAALAETRFLHNAADDPAVTTVGHLAIAGDLRLWNRDGLRSRAGGRSATEGMDDRRLLLEAYRRSGIDFLDDVDGDFAFVIWDDQRRRVIAVRDRFGVKPLFFERTASGIRLASEVKQLAATSDQTLKPNERSSVEYLTGRHTETRMTFFEGIERVRPSEALVADPTSERRSWYWNPTPDSTPSVSAPAVAEGFRERLVDAVRHRLDTADSAISHLTGGLDSTSIAASAHILADRRELDCAVHTVSAVFPGLPNDESKWIAATIARQPFPHSDFIPQPDSITALTADMWRNDAPPWSPIPSVWRETAATGRAAKAELVLTGYGGDEVLDQSHLLADLLRQSHIRHWFRGVRSYSGWSNRNLGGVMATSVRRALPLTFKRSLRTLLPRPAAEQNPLIHPDAWNRLQVPAADENRTDFGFPSHTQNLVISSARAPHLVLFLEQLNAGHARIGLDVTHPFLDRTIVEYVASVASLDRPFDGSSKTLVREGFSPWLPRSVLDRRTKTVANEYLDTIAAHHGEAFRSRYPTVSEAAQPYIDTNSYLSSLRSFERGAPLYGDGSLWRAWTLMAWLDGFDQYRHPCHRDYRPC